MWKEFREFVARGNVMDLAVGVVIGAAFGKIVDSLVNEVIMPPIGLVLGGADFSNLFITLRGGPYATLAQAKADGAPTIAYGAFFNTVIQFLIVAFAIFLIVRQYNRFRRRRETAPTKKQCPYCLMEVPVAATKCAHCTSLL